MTTGETASIIESGRTALGIEFGSTRIKAVLNAVDGNEVLAVGTYDWENSLRDGYWTYSEQEVFEGLAGCYAALKADVAKRHGVALRRIGALGISAMMHGYLPFDAEGELLVPFRTWRNTTTTQAATELTRRLGFHIPERWSIAHLYQAILSGEPHVARVASMTTLAGFVHRRLTGENVLSIGDASGMFPVDSATRSYDKGMLETFDAIPAVAEAGIRAEELLPRIAVAGDVAGHLTPAGALLLDAEGDLEPGCPVCPPEGDAGTGMIATNSVAPRTGNVSAGTSVFSMVVLDRPLADQTVPEIDLVTTPVGDAVAMVHCNNCTSDINAWVGLFESYNRLMGFEVPSGELFERLFRAALEGEKDCGGLVSVPFVSGEPIMGVQDGCPLVARTAQAKLDVATFMRLHIMSAFGTLKVGNDILRAQGVEIDRLYGHGGIFKTPKVAQSLLAAAMNAPVTVLPTAGEGGAWGQAVAAAYMLDRAAGESLADYLADKVFAAAEGETLAPDPADVAGFDAYVGLFGRAAEVEKAAEAHLIA